MRCLKKVVKKLEDFIFSKVAPIALDLKLNKETIADISKLTEDELLEHLELEAELSQESDFSTEIEQSVSVLVVEKQISDKKKGDTAPVQEGLSLE